jgi:hypothetical protein
VRYGKVSRQGMNAIRALIRKGKVESNWMNVDYSIWQFIML